MSSDSINNVSRSYLQPVISTALRNAGLSDNVSKTSGGSGASPFAVEPDNGQLSPFAQLMSTLQQLQQSDPAKYQQVTKQIAANLQQAAGTAETDGNVTAAGQLEQLAKDFTDASNSGQLPNIQSGVARPAGSHAHHHHHVHAAPADSNQTTDAASDPLNPANIILNTLSGAGVAGSQ